MAEVLVQPLPDSSKNTPVGGGTPVKNVGPRIALDDVTEHNKLQLKKINMSILPVQYNDSFYKEAVASEIHCCKLAYFNDLVVGGMCFRLEDSSDPEIGMNKGPISEANTANICSAEKKRVYIMTLGCLTPYRRYGIGSKLVEFIIQQAKDYGDVDGVFLHVQTNNDVAKAFYEKNGFSVIGDVKKDYYRRVEPRDAYLLGFNINPTGIKKVKLSSNVSVVSNLLEKEKEEEKKTLMMAKAAAASGKDGNNNSSTSQCHNSTNQNSKNPESIGGSGNNEGPGNKKGKTSGGKGNKKGRKRR